MAKKSAILLNNKRQQLIELNRKKRALLKNSAYDKSLSPKERMAAQIKLSELPRNSSRVRYRNRCAITGRPRGYYRKFDLSRISLRNLASWGDIPGLIKSSW
ncbi:30S ribosomal protein S14 [Rickettsiales bacterium]|jgi:small subunit ribosomal protein S14|nr:30S ribosomal protein S14 [Rickettsiales bacterium]|tara:strand:+ start:6137 stop:6442 length:306 start_codon:yes stop_codon:yes gene_type:complete